MYDSYVPHDLCPMQMQDAVYLLCREVESKGVKVAVMDGRV